MYQICIPTQKPVNEIHGELNALFGYVPGSGLPRPYQFYKSGGQVLVRSHVLPLRGGLEIKPETLLFEEGENLRIGVTLDPFRRNRNREIPVQDPPEVWEWSRELLEKQGLEVQSLSVKKMFSPPAHSRQKVNPIPLYFWEVEAEVKVADPEKFRQALAHGVGRKRVYGAGMIRVSGAQTQEM